MRSGSDWIVLLHQGTFEDDQRFFPQILNLGFLLSSFFFFLLSFVFLLSSSFFFLLFAFWKRFQKGQEKIRESKGKEKKSVLRKKRNFISKLSFFLFCLLNYPESITPFLFAPFFDSGKGMLLLFCLLFWISSGISQNLLTPKATLTSGATGTVGFGSAVASSGSLVVVGAPSETVNGNTSQGAAYVFNCASLPTCSLVTKLILSNGAAFDQFGTSVAISGSRVAIGAPGRESSQGAAFVYSCSSSSCTLSAQLVAPVRTWNSDFGFSVSISGSLVMAGSPMKNSWNGEASLFNCSSFPCTLAANFTPPDTTSMFMFGRSVDISRGLVAIGAPYAQVGSNTQQGQVFLYNCTSLPCSKLTCASSPCSSLLVDTAGKQSEWFGVTVSISGAFVGVSKEFAQDRILFDCSSIPCTKVASYSYSSTYLSVYGSLAVAGGSVYNCSSTSCTSLAVLSTNDFSTMASISDSLIVYGQTSSPESVFIYSAKDDNECALGTDTCDPQAICTNTFGSFACACPQGFTGDGFFCDDHDECTLGTDTCDVNANCINTPGSYNCTCKQGYAGNGFSCSDQNECTLGIALCSAHATCTNTAGSYTCACLQGFSGNGFNCTDNNECQLGTQKCDAHATCTNTAGSYTCACPQGFTGNGFTCTDQDECALGTYTCQLNNSTCSNTPGSYVCVCGPGRIENGTSCSDANECVLGTSNCDHNAICTNTAGSFTCACKQGFTGNGVQCSDANECALGTSNCDPNAICTNTAGSFTCACRSGFTGDGYSCSDIDECAIGTDNCASQANCSNTMGSFTCLCKHGYSWSDTLCTDIDECQLPNICTQYSTCSNSYGSYSCACHYGFVQDGASCSDIDECALGTDTCSSEAKCVNIVGSYACSCPHGQYWDKVSCLNQYISPGGQIGVGVTVGFVVLVIWIISLALVCHAMNGSSPRKGNDLELMSPNPQGSSS